MNLSFIFGHPHVVHEPSRLSVSARLAPLRLRMSVVKHYAVLDCNSGTADVYRTWIECKRFMIEFPKATVIWQTFETEAEAWDWIARYARQNSVSPSKPKRSDPIQRRESSVIDLSSSRSASPEERPRRTEPDTLSNSRSRHDSSSVIDLDPPSHENLDAQTALPLPKPNPDEDIVLSPEQEAVVKICEQGESIFFTGSAGTGKSVCLRAIIQRLRDTRDKGVYVTASTGIAAINVGGTTLHSFAGVGFGKQTVEEWIEQIMGPEDVHGNRPRRSKLYKRWREVKVLIIDEISMIDGKFFDKLERLARIVRDNKAPFGGIQLIVCGDFFQLPPVPDKLSTGQPIPIKFAFEAESWDRCIPRVISLKKVFRQKEGELITVLNMIRLGEVDALGLSIFRRIQREVKYTDQIKPTELFPRRHRVEDANCNRLRALTGEELTYYAEDRPGKDMHGHSLTQGRAIKLLDDTLAPRELRLRPGAQVMLIKNMGDTGLVNGSRGIVIGFETEDCHHQRIPSQQQQSDGKNNKKDSFSPCITVKTTKPPANPSQQPKQDEGSASGRERPRGLLYARKRWRGGKAIAAWALSIHKSQGQTLTRVKVNMDGTFEKGQAYVALSRATSLEGLQVLDFDPLRIMSHPRVIEWSKKLEDMNTMEKTGASSELYDSDEEMYWKEVD